MATPQPAQPGTPNQPPGANGPAAGFARRFFAPRLVFLTTMVYNLALLVVVAVYLYWPSRQCVGGNLCDFERWAWWQQILILGGVWLALLLACFLLVGGRIEQPGPARSSLLRRLQMLSDFRTTRELLAFFGTMLLIGLLIALFLQDGSVPLAMVVGLTVHACFWVAYARPLPAVQAAATDPYGAIGGFTYQLRTLWPFSLFWPNPTPPPGPAGGQIGNAVGQGGNAGGAPNAGGNAANAAGGANLPSPNP